MASLLKRIVQWDPLDTSGRKADKKVQDLINNRPQYTVNPAYNENQAIAANLAYGRNRAVTNAEANIDQSTASAIEAARNASGTSGSLMQAIVTAGLNKNAALTDLAGQEAQLQQQGLVNLQNANTALAEENDKAWNYNVNEPYQDKLARLALKKQQRQQTLQNVLSLAGTLGGAALGGPIGASAGGAIGKTAGSTI